MVAERTMASISHSYMTGKDAVFIQGLVWNLS